MSLATILEAKQNPRVYLNLSPAMNTLSLLSPQPNIFTHKPSQIPFLKSHTQTLDFCFPKPIRSSKRHQFRTLYMFKFPAVESQLLSDTEDDDEDDDDEEEVAEEYFVVSDGGEIDVEEEDGDAVQPKRVRIEEFKWQRVEKFCNEVKEFGGDVINAEELASVYDFPLDKFQRLAIQAFLRGSSVVVSAPTSSGKTLIAEAAAVATVARGRRLFYTTPLKALSNQKFCELRDTFGDSNVGLLTGDSVINKNAQVLIMTTEILRNMLYQSVGMISLESGLSHVDVIVLDEVQYLSDISRGTVWEEIVIYCPKEVQLVCLSATVANPDELAGWIGQIHGKTELVTSSKRPVPLTWHFSTKRALLPLLDERGTRMNRRLSVNYLQLNSSRGKSYNDEGSRWRISRTLDSNVSPLSNKEINNIRRSQVPQVKDTLFHLQAKDMLPAVWFIFSRKGCDIAVQYVEDCTFLNDFETSEVDLAFKKFRNKYPDAVRESAVKGIHRGVAAHHAGCLPLWKSFVEELFQQGLVKVVFATETLAAGINMPARTAVISSLSKRGESGRIQLSTNELLQMAGRAGRRGIDQRGHAVFLQTPFEGPEEGCKLLFGGLEPLVSQFTASYGMVLNLLAGAKVTHSLNEPDGKKSPRAGRTLEEARKLVEKSFGNYVGSNVMLAAKEELCKIEKEIETLTAEVSDEAIELKSRNILSQNAYEEMIESQKILREEKRTRTFLRRKMELERLSSLKPLLGNLDEYLPFICLQYIDDAGVKQLISCVYLGSVDCLGSSKLKTIVHENDSFVMKIAAEDLLDDSEGHDTARPSYHVALSSNNSWYLFTEGCIEALYRTGFPNVALAKGDDLPRELMTRLLDKEEMQWQKLSKTDFEALWCMEGSLEAWSWSLNVPVLSSLSEDDEVLELSQAYHDAVESYRNQREKVSHLKKIIARTKGFKEYKKILDVTKFTEEKIQRLKLRSHHLNSRIEQIEPSGWKEFLQVSRVIHESRALDVNTQVILPLGETAAAIRGENELWLAMVLRNKIMVDLKPAELAAVCGSLIGIKVRPSNDDSFIYEPSSIVLNVIKFLEDKKSSLLELQEKHGVQISCCLDSRFAGMVEAWASGLTWREIMMDCAMDEGDLARLLRRTIDILAQIPKLPDIDPVLRSNAMTASNVMDRPPLNELAG